MSEWFPRNGKSAQSLETAYLPGPCPSGVHKRKQHWPRIGIKDRPEWLKLQNLQLAIRTGRSTDSLPEKLTADVHYAINKMRIFGFRETIDPSRESIGHLQGMFPRHMAVLRRHLLPNVHFQCCVLLQDTLGGDFDTFAPSGEFHCLENPLKTNWREGLSCSQIQLLSTAFDPREWTMVVFWKEDSGRQPQLITPKTKEEMGPVLHHHQDLPSLMTLMFLLVLLTTLPATS